MALFHSPRIVTDGLIHYYDAANPKSYPGSGTTWYDLVGNVNGTLKNGASFSSVNNGVIVLDGTNQWIEIDPMDLQIVDYTIMGAARYVTIGGRTFSAKNNNWLMGHWSSSTVKHFASNWVTTSNSSEERDTNWRIYAATSDYSEDSWGFYVNGELVVSNSNGASGPYNFAIGSYAGVSEFSNSHISNLVIYDRVLTAAEIKQNYYALGGRFGV
jgi:hypothetical protein